jgi:predicted transcriptional regulator
MSNLANYRVCSGEPLTPAAKLLYIYLTDILENRSSVAISVKKLASGVGISRSAVRRSLHRLERLGMIGIVPRYTGDGGRLSNKYILL